MSKDKNQELSLGSVASFLSQRASIDEIVDTLPSPEDEEEIKDPSSDDLEDDKNVNDEEDIEKDEEEVDISTDDSEKDKPEDTDEEEVKDDEKSTDLGEIEPQLASYVQEKLYAELGLELKDDNKVESIEAIVEELRGLVEENSTPVYASSEIEELDNFVKNGGNPRDYFITKYSEGFDLEKADIENENHQKRILTEYFKLQGHTEERINKKLEKYEDTGILQEEAEEALEILTKDKTKNAEKLLREQENVYKENQKKQQKFISDVTSYIDNISDIMEVPLTKEKKAKLKANLLKVGDDGMTEYQRRYNESLVSNLVESVFLTTMRSELKNRKEKKASSNAAKILKEKIQSSKLNPRQKSGGYNEKTPTSNLLRKVAAGLK